MGTRPGRADRLRREDHQGERPAVPERQPKDEEINDYALPILVQETTDQQSAGIDMVSGATVTSTGYIQSLQSAIDQAGL